MPNEVVVTIFSVAEIFRKMLRDFELLNGLQNYPDHIFSFFITAYHLADYVADHQNVRSSEIYNRLEAQNPQVWSILDYFANGLKHRKLDAKKHFKTIAYAQIILKPLFWDGTHRLDATRVMSGIDYYLRVNDEDIHIPIFAERVVNLWRYFFRADYASFGLNEAEIGITKGKEH